MATSSRVLLQTLRRYTALSAVRLHQVLARVTIRMSSNATVSFGPVDAHIVPCDSFQTIYFTFAGSAFSRPTTLTCLRLIHLIVSLLL